MKPLNSLSVEQLAEISDIALHKAYHYDLRKVLVGEDIVN